MSVILYLIIVTLLLIFAVICAAPATIEASGLRWFDRTITPENERQNALLGDCIEWSRNMVNLGWQLIGISYFVIFSFALAAKPFSPASAPHDMPTLFTVTGLAASLVVLFVGRAVQNKARKLIRQYGEILDGKEPPWAAAVARSA